MAHIEKTVFISYRRKDISWALAVYQNLTSKGYDVFFDYTDISSGDFEQIIIGNIKARAHFLVLLTPSSLDRCNEPGDWLRREIETAIDEKRNIVPLFFDGFNFGSTSILENLTGKLADIKKYNGLEVPVSFFDEAMKRLRSKYLNIALEAVLHPVSDEVQEVVDEQQIAAYRALSKKERESLYPTMREGKDEGVLKLSINKQNIAPYTIAGFIIVVLVLFIFGGSYVFQNLLTPTRIWISIVIIFLGIFIIGLWFWRLRSTAQVADKITEPNHKITSDERLEQFKNDLFNAYDSTEGKTHYTKYIPLDLIKEELSSKYSQEQFNGLLAQVRRKFPKRIWIDRDSSDQPVFIKIVRG